MPRTANAVDFWRGFALCEIYVNHIPGNFYENFTHKALSQSDSAELFVFLAGWSMSYVIRKPDGTAPAVRQLARLLLRAGRLYAVHIVIVMMAIAMLAMASRVLADPLILEWFNAGAVFSAPVEAHIGLVILSYQLGYFDILPLYVALLLVVAPCLALLHWRWPALVLPLSALLYGVCLVYEITLPTWPVQGEWFFDPLCWQFDFVLGFAIGSRVGVWTTLSRPLRLTLTGLAMLVVAFGAVARYGGFEVDPTAVPEPHLLFVNDKSFFTPTRMVQFLCLVVTFAPLYGHIERRLPVLAGGFALLGRHSLLVFSIGSLLSLGGQIVRFAFPLGVLLDTLLLAVGIIGLFMAARGADWLETRS